MTGDVLIIDAVATNRIILKVKLSGAYYSVLQAESAKDALELLRKSTPDLIIVNENLPDANIVDLIDETRLIADGLPPPVVVLSDENSVEARLLALRNGAAEVIGLPFDDEALMARLRSLVRQRHVDRDFGAYNETTDAIGFAEDPVTFAGPDRIALLGEDLQSMVLLRNRLKPLCKQDLKALSILDPNALQKILPRSDVVVVHIGTSNSNKALQTMAELAASSETRHARFVALLDDQTEALAARALDIGASDAVPICMAPRELALRLTIQTQRKKQADLMRGRLENGLQAALVDPLTGLHNRRYAENFLRRMITRARDEGSSFAIMLTDLDHFKRVNDTFGHSAGDLVLADVARKMRAALPKGAMIARIGGEEFLIAVPNTTLSRVSNLAERLRRSVSRTPTPLADGSDAIDVTVSIGVTMVGAGTSSTHISAKALIEQADRALYDSKASGRDTVTVSLRTAA